MDKIELDTVTYEQTDDDIHSLTLHQEERQTIDDIFDIIDKLYATDGTDHKMRFLIDASNVVDMPFRYMSQKSKSWQESQTNMPPSRTAVLYKQNPLMEALTNLIVGYFNKKHSPTKLFNPKDREQALDWLLSE